MKKCVYIIIIIALFILAFMFINCTGNKITVKGTANYTSYLDIPGITPDETIALQALQKKYSQFKYGVPVSTEAFYDENGEINGFSSMFCEWLSTLFGINFKPVNCEFADMFTSLKTGEIDFAGGLAASGERREKYYMTDPIAERTLKYFYLADSKPLSAIKEIRPLKLAFLENSATTDFAFSQQPGTYEPVFIKYNDEAYKLLKSSKADAFVHQNTTDVIFINHRNVASEDFSPSLFTHVSLTAQNSEYAVIISVVQKALKNGQLKYLAEMYNKGEHEYKKHKLMSRLTEKEKAYINNNPVIPLAAEYSNYPVSFYNKFENQWQGISQDILKEITGLTGLKFDVVNNSDTEWPDLLKMLDSGKASVISELLQLKSREDYFLWTDKTILTDRPALISKYGYHDIMLSEILHVKIGAVKNSVYTDLFKEWFPHHTDLAEYKDTDSVISALVDGKVDMALLSENQLLNLTNYKELVGYKTNLYFNYNLDSTFGLNKNEKELCSILNKTLDVIDTDKIVDRWLNKTYDYRMKVAQAQRPLFIGAAVLLLCVLVLIVILLIRKHKENKKLWVLQNSILNIVSDLIEYRDGTTGGHISRTQRYIECLINKCIEKNVYVSEIKAFNTDVFVSSSQLHDVGKIAIPDSILNKPGKLTNDEYDVMKTHASIGAGIISRMTENSPDHDFFDHAQIFAAFHHEKWDGSGYPHKMEGLDIPLEGRLMALVDVYDALVSERPYKKAFTPEDAAKIIFKESGSHFDPELVRMFKLAEDKFAGICLKNH